jgi:hypothetical protein
MSDAVIERTPLSTASSHACHPDAGGISSEKDEELIACLLSERDYAIRGDELASGLFAVVEEIVELPDGYAYRFADDGHLSALLEFIAAERHCCPFLTFEIAFEPHAGPLWLRMRGSPRVKAFVAEAFNRVAG